MIIIVLCVTFLYVLLIGSFIYGFDKVSEFHLEETPNQTNFSIIIPFRNEAENLPDLLDSISKLKYSVSNFEIIFVNDESQDASVEIINKHLNKTEINFKIIQNKRTSKSPKKDAISIAVEHASNPWIITTDADCLLPKLWLDSYNCFINKTNCIMIAGPVAYYKIHTFLDRFQTFDFLSLIGATIGGFGLKAPFLSNGANLAYKKSFFKTLNGFEGNNNIASGDDVFLLEKAIKKNKDSVMFIKAKDAIVLTKPQPNFKNLISQRIRWASKTTHYNSNLAKVTSLIVLIMNATLISLLLLTIIGYFNFITLLIVYILKIAVDFVLLFKTAQFFNQKHLFFNYPISALIYPFFCVYIAVVSLFTNYKWKGRAYKK